MEIRHFSHDHPLVLMKQVLSEADDDGKFVCYACQQSLSRLELAYGCGQCKYFLHKECAVREREITHPQHDEHSLILLHRSPYDLDTYYCSVCGITYVKSFVYHCSLCEFDLCMACAPKVNDDVVLLCTSKKEQIIKHEGHQHPLIFQSKPSLFRCDACDMEDKDTYYICPSCPFCIHEHCASLPSSSKHKDHLHTLSLTYALPSNYRKFFFECEVCGKGILPAYWVYFCGPCRYFVHLKCMTQQQNDEQANSEGAQHQDDDDANFKDDDDGGLLYLPATDISKELIARLLVKENDEIQLEPEINHFSHKQHPLILFHEDNNDDNDDHEEILCNGCITPISAPYYTCVECSYFLHLTCAKLPDKLQHRSHMHLLTLHYYQHLHSIFNCNNCGWSCNGFFFKCDICDFFLDIKCAALPTVIKHKDHKHPLFQCVPSTIACHACGKQCSGPTFRCASCKFYLGHDCAMLPAAINHRWDPHPLPLTFPPFTDLPDEFYCDICEKEMNPKRWIYRCSQCNINNFHPYCVPRLGRFRNIKLDGMLKLVSHPHPLKFVRKATLKSSCDHCGRHLSSRLVFECEDCNYCLCHFCASYKSKSFFFLINL